jgi:hypothetical protein
MPSSQPLGPTFIFPVVGVTFCEGYPDNLIALAELWEQEGHHEEGVPVVLMRNPLNEYDSNAIEVHLPAMSRIGKIGHVPKEIAARLAPELDAGLSWHAAITEVLIHSEHIDRPGLRVKMRRVVQETDADG